MNMLFPNWGDANRKIEELLDKHFDIKIAFEVKYNDEGRASKKVTTSLIDTNFKFEYPEEYKELMKEYWTDFYNFLDRNVGLSRITGKVLEEDITIEEATKMVESKLRYYEENHNFIFKDYFKYKLGVPGYDFYLGYEVMEKLKHSNR